ncbi:MAG: hypothetical protein NUW06_04950 [Candidatus Acetothermia bacterium]|jgi:hypothetical protein|nr:hypothetical protein [Candidatus Acetothermia bacterium]MDH7505191.1 hypothetical protein [Candidatus Acetothermia bacterium]
MRKVLALLVGGLLVAGLAIGGLAVPLCSYTQPESRYTNLGLALNYRFFDDQYRDNRGNISAGSAALDFSSFFDSASYGYNSTANLKISYNNGALGYSGIGSGSYQMYLKESDLFGFGSLVLRASSAYKNLGLNAITGAGYGRFRDVTPLAKAMRIGEMLLGMKSISQPLPDQTLMAVAQEIGKRAEYEKLEQLVQKITELIERTGLVTAGKLGAVEGLRIEEIVLAVGGERLCGWDVRGGVGYEVLDPLGHAQDSLVFAGANYAAAPAPNAQLLAKADFSSSFELLENYSLSAVVSYFHRAGPALSYTFSYNFLRLKQPAEPEVDSQAVDLKALFQVSGGWNVAAGLSLKWETGYEDWTKEFSITANYTIF